VATLLVHRLEKLDPQFPLPEAGVESLRIE